MPPAQDSDLYNQLMRFKPEQLTANAWAVKAGVSRTVWADMRRHGNPSRRTLEKLLSAAGSSLAEFEALRILPFETGGAIGTAGTVGDRQRPWLAPSVPPLPLVATSPGSPDQGIERMMIERARVIDHVPRPPSLAGDPDAYAIAICGDAMWPRFSPGMAVAVSPGSTAKIGDDVLVEVRSAAPGLAMVKRLSKRSSSSIELRQFNPDAAFSIAADEVVAIHRIAGELI